MAGARARAGSGAAPLISVCIPAYNRARFLPEAFDSILRGIERPGTIQICVSDNASTDGTEQVVAAYSEKHPGVFKFSRNERNMGFDQNLLRAAAMADGEYCWLFGSDDAMEDGAIGKVLRAIRSGGKPSMITVNYQAYDFTLGRKVAREPRAGLDEAGGDGAFLGEEGVKRFVRRFFDHFGYMSAQIVRRDLWKAAAEGEDLRPYFNGYIHLYLITKMMRGASSAYYISAPLVKSRSGNDSFTSGGEEGPLRRCMIDVEGYTRVAEAVLKPWDRGLYRAMMARVMRDYIPPHLSRIKKSKAPLGKKAEVWRKVMATYWWMPGAWVRLLPLMIVPRPVFISVRNAYRAVRRRE